MLRSRRAVGTLLVGTMMVSGLMQYGLAALGPVLSRDLVLSHARVGALSSVYFLAAMTCSVPIGRWVSRNGGRAGLIATIIASLAGALIAAAASSYAWLLVGVGCAGLAAAAANPATNLTLAQVPKPHGLLVGLKQSGVAIGAVLTGLVLPGVAEASGWRTCFVVCGALAAIALPLAYLQPRQTRHGAPGRRLKTPFVIRILTAYSFCMGAALATIITYLPLYAHENLHMSIGRSGALVAVIGGCGIAARVVVSVVAGRSALGAIPNLLCGLAASSLVGLLLVVTAEFRGAAPLWAGAFLLGLTSSAWNGAVMLTLLRVSDDVGRSSGLVLTGFFAGLAVMPVAFGYVVDRTGSFRWGWMMTALALLLATAVASLVLRRSSGLVELGAAPFGADN